MMKQTRYIIYIIAAAFAILAYSCSTTKRIPQGELLYTGLKGVKVYPDSVDGKAQVFPKDLSEVLTSAVDAATNKRTLYLFPIGLWVYNNWSDTCTGFKRKLYDKWVEDPILVSDVRPELRVKMLDRILHNNGYFGGSASYALVQPADSARRASIRYDVYPGKPYAIDSLILLPDTSAITHFIDSVAVHDRYLGKIPGVTFSLDSLSEARSRIVTVMRNRGYYFFNNECIEYLADSIMHPGSVVLKLDLTSNMPQFVLDKYTTGKITINTFRYEGGGTPDTIKLDRATLIQMKPSRLRPQIFNDNVSLRPGRTISVRAINNTQSYLSRLGIFNAINIETSRDTTARVPTIDVNINATMDAPLEASLEVNATSKSNSYIGPGLTFGVTNHNIFGGGEQLSVNLAGSYEWQTGKGSNRSIFNSYEASITASLAFPRLLAPAFIKRRRRQLNWTRITLNADLLNRPHFFKMAQFNSSFSYDWASSRYISNSFTPFKLTYTKLMKTTEVFDSMMVANPAVALSFQSRFIPQMSYSLTFDRAYGNDNRLNWQVSLSQAGNLFWSIYELSGVKGEKRMFGTPFSQFIKGSTQLVWAHRTNGNSWVVSRVAVGAAHAYGNSSQVPYSEQFYCGGANSVRAFTVRSIGPGSYHDPRTDKDFFDQTGTFKFEANVEYRFPIYSIVNGAVFFDAGNVWLLRDDPLRPGGTLRGRTFFKDLATGTGVGIRFDIGMLVLRGDLGIGIHAPYDTGKSGYYNMTSFGRSLAFHLAIGYPF